MNLLTRQDTTIEELLENIQLIGPIAEEEAPAGARLNRPTPRLQRALAETGIFGMLLPRELGGYDASPTEALQIIEKISHVDASLGWIVRVIAGETANAAHRLSVEALTELGSNVERVLIGGQSSLVGGTAKPVEGGYVISGSWKYAPGLTMATHVALRVNIEGRNDTLLAIVGREELNIQDNWSMLGLKATATFDYEAQEIFVAEKFTFTHAATSGGSDAQLLLLKPELLSALNQGGWAQGVGRRMLEELRALALASAATEDTQLSSDEFFAEYARHHSHVRGTMALLKETWRDIEEDLVQSGKIAEEHETMARLAASLSTRTLLEIAQLIHRYAGEHVMRDGTIQRLFRDSHAGTQHRANARVVSEECGRFLIGVTTQPTAGGHK